MYGWLVAAMIRRSIRRLNAGDLGPLLASYAQNVHFVFPGESSFAADIHGKEELEAWLRRFVDVGLQLETEDILVSGWLPWGLTVCVTIIDRARDAAGEVVYENRGVIVGKIVWGKIKSYEVFLDTERLTAFDQYLARQRDL